MFSTGQLIFAACFVVVFTFIIIYSYRKDRKDQKEYFKGSFKIILFMIGLIFSLFLIKVYTQK
ncbi:MAG: cytochrome bd-type quinol oxidase subunit 1 [Candidatus Marivariicella framensis]|jgi:cytochrome bd-type quinol oxidase subunit 1|tara:strand:- start:910 stop:1098 length:189 start_codon:yes stop_codon:yes gene_type:complete